MLGINLQRLVIDAVIQNTFHKKVLGLKIRVSTSNERGA
jgi:hypothetical protein